jgi:hypothetical protein
MRGVAVLLAVSLTLAAVTPAAAQLYSWTDANGVRHYTADPWAVPPAHRGSNPPPAAPASPRVSETWATVATVPVGTVVEFVPGAPIVVSALLNGALLALLLDTGADRTVLSPDAVARAGYAGLVVAGEASVRILGVTGSATAGQVLVPLLDVAGARIGPLALLVHDAGLGTIDGLLGRDVLEAFTVTIDAAAGRATLVPR